MEVWTRIRARPRLREEASEHRQQAMDGSGPRRRCARRGGAGTGGGGGAARRDRRWPDDGADTSRPAQRAERRPGVATLSLTPVNVRRGRGRGAQGVGDITLAALPGTSMTACVEVGLQASCRCVTAPEVAGSGRESRGTWDRSNPEISPPVEVGLDPSRPRPRRLQYGTKAVTRSCPALRNR